MEVKINFSKNLERDFKKEINFIKEEFELLFGHKIYYTEAGKRQALDLLKYLTKNIDSPIYLRELEETLTFLEEKYVNLFI